MTIVDQRFFGIDISVHQGSLDWDIVASHIPTVMFVGIRAGISWGYTDKMFRTNWEEAKRVGIPRTAYHVFYPAEDVVKQVANFRNIVGDDFGELPVTADVELVHDVSKTQFATNLKKYLDEIEKVFGRKPIIYSRASFINEYVGSNFTSTFGNDYLWWLAHYGNVAGEEVKFFPAMPRYIVKESVAIHQNGDKFKSIGGIGNSMDFNRWLKTPDDFYELAKIKDIISTDDTTPEINSKLEKTKLQLISIKDEINNVCNSVNELIDIL